MKQLFESVKENFIIEKIINVDCEMINESLKSSILKDLAKQLLDQVNDEKKQKENDTYKTICNRNFKKIFGTAYVPWNEIEDKDIQVIDAQTWDDNKEKNKTEKLIRSIIKGSAEGIIISKNPKTDKFDYFIYTWGTVYMLTSGNNYYSWAGKSIGDSKYDKMTQRDKINLFSNKIIYYIDTSKFSQKLKDLKKDRYERQSGTINFDPESLSRIARENQERYKKIISQNKANNTKNDKLLDEAQSLINEVVDITIKVAKDPITYSDLLFKVQDLSTYIYDKREYINGTGRRPGYYSGKNGLIYLVTQYIEAIKDAKSGYSWGSKNIDNTTKQLGDTITKCQSKINEIKELL